MTGFLAYREDFEYADAARAVMAAFNDLRAQQDPPAKKLMGEARGAFNQGRRDEGYAKAKRGRRQVLRGNLLPTGQAMGGRAEMIIDPCDAHQRTTGSPVGWVEPRASPTRSVIERLVGLARDSTHPTQISQDQDFRSNRFSQQFLWHRGGHHGSRSALIRCSKLRASATVRPRRVWNSSSFM